MASFNTLSDNFADGSIARAWQTLTTGSGAASEASGRATLALPSSTAGTHTAYYRSLHTYDLTADAAAININGMVSTSVAATFTFDVFADANNVYRWQQVSGTLTARKVVAGTDTQLYTVAWNATTFKYLRIRESGGTVFFDSSSNGTSWTNRATQTVAGAFAVTALYTQFGASCGNVASPGTLTIEDFNATSLSSTWRWVQGARAYISRMGSVSLAATGGVGYLAIASTVDASGNLVSPVYYSGPLADGRELTLQASQAAAEAAAARLPTDGRWHVPPGAFVEGRYVRLYMRSHDGASFTLREFYPRRYVQADDIEAESIRAVHIAANSITADKLSVLQLSAITADMGSITAGTITGALIRTAASGARIEQDSANGLRSFNSGGTVQVQLRTTDGALTAGGGVVKLADDGMTLTASTNVGSVNALRWYSGANEVVRVDGYTGTQNNLALWARRTGTSNDYGRVTLSASDYDSALNSEVAQLVVQGKTSSAAELISLKANDIYLGLGTTIATVRANGSIQADGAVTAGSSVASTGGRITHQLTGQSAIAQMFTFGNVAYLGSQSNHDVYFRTNDGDGMRLTAGSNYLRIGDGTAPAYRVELPNTASAAGQGRANAWVTYSSRTRKRNVAELPKRETRQLVKALRAVSFDWEEGGRDVGLIAEEVAEIAPDLVTGDITKPETLGIKLDRVALLLLPLVQELLEEVEALEQRVAGS
jgi:hypothetical protein